MDRSLPSSARSPLRPPPATQSMAPQMDDRRVAAQTNNLYARTGAREMGLQDMDRAGVSRGKGQQFRAEMAGAAQDSANRADALRSEMGASQANVAAAQQYDAMQRSERLASEGLLQNLRDSERQERLAQRASGMDSYDAWMRGQLGLASMQLDYTPLLRQLFSN